MQMYMYVCVHVFAYVCEEPYACNDLQQHTECAHCWQQVSALRLLQAVATSSARDQQTDCLQLLGSKTLAEDALEQLEWILRVCSDPPEPAVPHTGDGEEDMAPPEGPHEVKA